MPIECCSALDKDSFVTLKVGIPIRKMCLEPGDNADYQTAGNYSAWKLTTYSSSCRQKNSVTTALKTVKKVAALHLHSMQIFSAVHLRASASLFSS